MAVKVAINGYGRIGRNIMRAVYEYNRRDEIEIVAINDLGDADTNAHLTQFDTAHGRFAGDVSVDGGDLVVNGDRVRVFAERDPAKLPWSDLGVDVVYECTGLFRSRETAGAHIAAGASKVIISAPGQDVDNTIVYGVNHDTLKASDRVISNASCTTNCLAPLAKALHEGVGIQSGLMTTIHAYTGDQRILDAPHKDLRRARAAAINIVPTSTGAAKAVGLVLPHLNGKLDGGAVRVPTPTGSLTDFVCEVSKETTAEEVNAAFKAASEGALKGILEYSTSPLVSTDIVGNPHSNIFDSDLTKVDGTLVKVIGWYDNEAGYSMRTADLITRIM